MNLPISILVPPGEEKPGDIYSAKSPTIQSFLIRLCTGSEISHVGGIISEWHDGYIETVDAVFPRVEITKSTEINGQVWRLWRNEEEQQLLVSLMKKDIGKLYDVVSVFRIFAYGVICALTLNYWKPTLPVFKNCNFIFCSEETMLWIEYLGYKHPKYSPKELHPGEFARFLNWFVIRSMK